MKSRLLPSAEPDLRWFLRYYSEVFPEGRMKAVKRYKNARHVIEQHTNAGSLQTDGRMRVFPIPSTPFSLQYVVYADFVGITRIVDQRQDPARLLEDNLR